MRCGSWGATRWASDAVTAANRYGRSTSWARSVIRKTWPSPWLDGGGTMRGWASTWRNRRGPTARAARLVCRPSEMAWADPEAGTQRLTMLFSAKEAVFKALYPIEHVWLGFADAELTWRADHDAFEASMLKSAGAGYPVGFRLSVNCTVGDAWVLSTALVPARLTTE